MYRGGYRVFSCVVWPSSHEHTSTQQQQQHSAAPEQHSIRTALVRVLLVLLCFCVPLPLEQYSSARACVGFQAWPTYCTAKKTDRGPRSPGCSSTTSTRQTQARCGQAITGTGALSNSSISSSSTQRHSSNTWPEQHSFVCCCCHCCVLLEHMNSSSMNLSSTAVCCCSCSKKWESKIFAAKNTKIRVGFQAPGWLSGSGTPSPELLAGSRDFDHVEHGPRSPPGANAYTILSTPPPCGPRSRKHEKRPAAKRQK